MIRESDGLTWLGRVFGAPLPRVSDCRPHLRPLPAFADGPVADTAEPVTPQAVVSRADSDGDDLDSVGHD